MLLRRFNSSLATRSWAVDHADNLRSVITLQKNLIALGSSLISLRAPWRTDMIYACCETTASVSALENLRSSMAKCDDGRRILSEKPRISSRTVDFQKLSNLDVNTFGRQYADWLDKNQVTPDNRKTVTYIRNPELAYIVQRYREIHDLHHTMLNMGTNMLGETTVKCFEAIQTGLPMCIMGAIGGVTRLGPKHRTRYFKQYMPWAISTASNARLLMSVYFEEHFEDDIDELREKLGIKLIPSSNK